VYTVHMKKNRRESLRISDIVRTVDKYLLKNEDAGKLVRYYKEGWYHGYLMKVSKAAVTIQPIGAIGGKKPHPVIIPLKDVELVRMNEDQRTGV
jgi:hypothetical protein